MTVAGLEDPCIDGVKWIPISRYRNSFLCKILFAITLLLRYYSYFEGRFALAKVSFSVCYDLVICHDVEPLPMAFRLAKGAPVVYDAHEYSPREFEDSCRWRVFIQPYVMYLCKKYLTRCAAIITVSKGVADAYSKDFSIVPTIIFSAPEYEELCVHEVDAGNIRIIHHGFAHPSRHIERMIETVQFLESRFSLDLMMVGSGAYYEQIRILAKKTDRVFWVPPVPMTEISSFINKYDIGFFLLEPANFNYMHALPNKFFEYIQARLAIAIGPSPEMQSIVKEYQIGIIASDFTPKAMADVLNKIDAAKIAIMKKNSENAARIFNSENEMTKLKVVLDEILG